MAIEDRLEGVPFEKKEVIKLVDKEVWKKLNDEYGMLRKEYAELKNKPKPFETEDEKEVRELQYDKDRAERSVEFQSLGDDFKKKRTFFLEFKKQVQVLKIKERKIELEQKLLDQTITEKDLLELQVLNSHYASEAWNEEKQTSER